MNVKDFLGLCFKRGLQVGCFVIMVVPAIIAVIALIISLFTSLIKNPDIILCLFLGALCLGVYLLPAIVAKNRNHTQIIPILVLNILLGWTLIVWVGCLVWALIKEKDPIIVDNPTQSQSYIEELENLADLKNKGILTEEEFTRKKKQILDTD